MERNYLICMLIGQFVAKKGQSVTLLIPMGLIGKYTEIEEHFFWFNSTK